MSSKALKKTSFEVAKELRPIYTGGKVCFGDDERTMATTLDERVQVTDVDTGRPICSMEGDGEPLNTIAMTPDSRMVITFSRSLQMRIHEIPSGKCLRSIKAHDAPVITAETDETSTLVATGGAEGFVKVWDIAKGYITHNFRGHGRIISALKFSSGAPGLRLVSGSEDNTIRVWDLRKSTCLSVLKGHDSVVRGLDFTDNGWTMVSAARDGLVCIWEMKSFTKVRKIAMKESVEAVGLLPIGKQGILYTGGEDGYLRFWEWSNGKKVHEIEDGRTAGILDIHHRKSSLLCISDDQTIIRYSIRDGRPVSSKVIAGHHDEIIDLAFVENDQKLALATNSEEIRVLDIDGFGYEALVGHSGIVVAIDCDPKGDWIASASKDNLVKLWHHEDGRWVDYMTFSGHTESVGAVALPRSPSSYNEQPKFLLSGSKDRTIKLWEVPASRQARAMETRKAHDKDINALAMSADDCFFASASQDKTCKIWSMATCATIGLLKGHQRGVWSVKFSPDDKTIVTASGDKTVRIWNLATFACIQTLQGHSQSVLKAIFISQGTQIVSGGSDGLVKVWNVSDSECVATLDNHEDRVWSLAVRHDDEGSEFVSGGGDSLLTVWKDTTEREQALVQARFEEQVQDEQQLSNHIQKQEWRHAILLALSLEQPYRLLNIFKQVAKSDQGMSGMVEVDEVLASLSDSQLTRLLLRIRDWNTHAKTAELAQRVLYILVKSYPSSTILKLKDSTQIIDSILSYTERHYNHAIELTEECYLVDYTLQQM